MDPERPWNYVRTWCPFVKSPFWPYGPFGAAAICFASEFFPSRLKWTHAFAMAYVWLPLGFASRAFWFATNPDFLGPRGMVLPSGAWLACGIISISCSIRNAFLWLQHAGCISRCFASAIWAHTICRFLVSCFILQMSLPLHIFDSVHIPYF